MKQLRQGWPRRSAMLKMDFVPLSDADFKALVADGAAIPVLRGNSMFVAKWMDGPGTDPELFLTALRSRGSKLEIRRHESDVNIRIVEGTPVSSAGKAWIPRRMRPGMPS